MKPLYRGLLAALLQCALVLSMTAKYQWDRDRLPRVWVRVGPLDPNAPLRGRYLQLRVQAAMEGGSAIGGQHVRLFIQDGQLTAKADDTGDLMVWPQRQSQVVSLAEPMPFFLSDTANDPSQSLKIGQELWAEVSLPPNAMPRPIRLGVKSEGVITPLDLR